MSENWYKTGSAGEQAAKDEDQRLEAERKNRAFRFWIKPDEKAHNIIILDDEGFFVHEHNLKLKGQWGNHFTCVGESNNCALCDAGFTASFVAVYTILDLTPYEIQNGPNAGKIIPISKKLLVVKSGARNKLADRKEKMKAKGGMKYGKFELKRFSKKECNTGEQFEYMDKRATAAALIKLAQGKLSLDLAEAQEFIKPFDYLEIFKPKEPTDLQKIANKAAGFTGDDSSKGITGDDDDPLLAGGDDTDLFSGDEDTKDAATTSSTDDGQEDGGENMDDLLTD